MTAILYFSAVITLFVLAACEYLSAMRKRNELADKLDGLRRERKVDNMQIRHISRRIERIQDVVRRSH